MITKANYIKVTLKGETRSAIILAANEQYYRKLGAKIEEPTEAEILKAFPELNISVNIIPQKPKPAGIIVNEAAQNLLIRKDELIAKFKADLEFDNQEFKRLNSEIEKLKADKTKQELASANRATMEKQQLIKVLNQEHEATYENLNTDLLTANQTIDKLKIENANLKKIKEPEQPKQPVDKTPGTGKVKAPKTVK